MRQTSNGNQTVFQSDDRTLRATVTALPDGWSLDTEAQGFAPCLYPGMVHDFALACECARAFVKAADLR